MNESDSPEVVRSSDQLGRYWKAKVDCWFVEKRNSKVHKRVRRTILLWAADYEDAMKVAAEHASSTAPMGPLWIGFEVLEAATVNLPLTVHSSHVWAGVRPNGQLSGVPR